MNPTLICTIPSPSPIYEIAMRRDCLSNPGVFMRTLPSLRQRVAVVTDDTVALLYAQHICHHLVVSGIAAELCAFPSGEKSKTRATKELLEDQLFARGFGRDTTIIAVGGGVVTDMAGYLAATYCRGVQLIMIPTSLLAMVDASIGGKAAVDVPSCKNLVGCFYQPSKVIIDPSALATLPLRELRNGIVEMIKKALVADPAYFDFLETHVEELLSLNAAVVDKAIFESCRIKKEFVEQDERDCSKRRLLNFGHTIGHALEVLTKFSLSHGEAVAIGILVESYIAERLGKLSNESLERIQTIFRSYGLTFRLPEQYSIKNMCEAVLFRGQPRFVLISGIGLPFSYGMEVDKAVLEDALGWMNDVVCFN
jgi:3-dehydroquinate synthase